MFVVHRHTPKPTLPEVPRPLLAGVDVAGLATVGRGEGPAQTIIVRRDQDQVRVIGHQHPGPDLDACGLAIFGQQGPVEVVIFVAENVRARPLPRCVTW